MDRFNRVLWTIIALIVAAVGALWTAAGRGVPPGVDPRRPLVPREWFDQWRSWGSWAWTALAVAGLVLAWLGWRLLRAELRVGPRALPSALLLRSGTEPGRPAGRVRLRKRALARATERFLEGHPAVRRALVRLYGDTRRPDLRVRIALPDRDADLNAVSDHLTAALRGMTATSGLEPGSVHVTVRPGTGEGPRVH